MQIIRERFLKAKATLPANLQGSQALSNFLRSQPEDVDDPLKWWEARRERYGNELVDMALDYLSAPGMSVGNVVPQQSYLNPN